MSDLASNLQSVRQRISTAASRAGRDPAEITLVAVTKTQAPEVIREAHELGLRVFGENRVEEAETKVGQLSGEISWHMIGHIQSRKANRVASLFHVVHSVDSVKLARRLDRCCEALSNPLPVLLEFNVTGEPSKYGFVAHEWDTDSASREQLLTQVDEIISLPRLEVRGLMTMAPIVAKPEAARPVFVRLRQLRDQLAGTFRQVEWGHLSMGMTDDFDVAIEEGSTHVRIGRAIFSPALPAWRKG
ncbi:YggS family pyridoxal phosphate-dependent enzyme [Chloroflexota bacterium]